MNLKLAIKRFTQIEGGKVRSDDGVVINPHCSHGYASYEYNGERWIIPWEAGVVTGRNIVYDLFISSGATYKEDAIGVPVGEPMLRRLRGDMRAAFEAVGCKVVVRY